MIKLAIPVIQVTSSAAAEQFYSDLLGFNLQFATPADRNKPDPCYMGFSRDEVMIHVSSFPGDGVSGGVALLLVEDVDRLYAEFLAKGVPVAMAPTDQTWGNREMYVRDPDNNSVRFVQQIRR